MDFVVIGLGLSALALLTGLTLLCLVAPRWFRKAGVPHPGDAAYARAQAGERRALGQGFLCVGAVLLLATLGGISAGLSDKAGAYLIASMTTLAALGLFGWDLLYQRQHPVPRRRRSAPTHKTSALDDAFTSVPQASLASPVATTTTVRRRVLPARQRAVPAAATVALADDELVSVDEQQLAEALAPLSDAAETPEMQSAVPGDGPEPETADDELPAEVAAAAEAAPDLTDESGSEAPAAGEPAEAVDALPKPLPLTPVHDNGAASATPEPDADPELVPHGDDRVIALFPTAAARRGRTVVAPTDPDGQS